MIGTTDKVIRQKGAYFRAMGVNVIKYSDKSIKTQKVAYFGDFGLFGSKVLTMKIEVYKIKEKEKKWK